LTSPADLQRLIDRQRTFLQPSRQRLPFQMGHDEEVRAVGNADVVDAADVRMIEGGDRASLSFEARA
jgi:hypothetical protein